MRVVVAPYQADRGVGRLAAARGEPEVVEVARRDRGELAGALDHGRAGVAVVLADVLQLVELRLDGVDDLAPAVPEVGAHHLRRRVEVLLALGVAQHDALGGVVDHAERLAQRDLGVQDVLLVVLDELFGPCAHHLCPRPVLSTVRCRTREARRLTGPSV